MEDISDLLTEGEAAEKLGYSKEWLSRKRRSGVGPPFILLGNRIYYEPKDVSQWVSNQRRQPTTITKE